MADKMNPDIAKFIGLSKRAKMIADTTEAQHSQAFLEGLKKITNKEGHVDYSLLDKSDYQKKFVDAAINHYIGQAKKTLKSGITEKDQLEADMLLTGTGNFTRARLNALVQQSGSDYTMQVHEGQRDRMIKDLRSTLYTSAAGHLKDDSETKGALAGAIKGAKESIDHKKASLQDLLGVYQISEQYGPVNKSILQKNLGKNLPYLK